MADSGSALLVGIITRLKAYSALTTALGGADKVYSDVEQGAAMPYISVSVQSDPWNTMDSTGMVHNIVVRGFLNEQSQKTLLDIRAHIIAALDREESNISVSGHNLIKCIYKGGPALFKDPDGTTWIAVCNFEVTVD